MRYLPIALAVLCLIMLPSAVSAQTQAPAPYAADTASVDSTIAALYDVISGPAGQARDWDRFKNLFAPGARLIPAAPRPDGAAPPVFSPDDYVQRASGAFLKSGFFEQETARVSEAYGTIVHVFSTYESRRAKADEKPFARGINSIQLMQHAGRWWVVTVLWDQEREGNPIPAKYLR